MGRDLDGPVLGLTINGLKCDAAGCDYFDADCPKIGEHYSDYLNAPCPKCGAPLLTEADLSLMQRIEAGAKFLNDLGVALSVKADKTAPHPKPIKLDMHGDGSLTVTLPSAA